jgi:RimJ/RimL family protein N-acetyltransferase
LGHVSAYDYRGGRTVFAAAFALPNSRGTGLIVEGFALLVEHLFANFDIDGVVIELTPDSRHVFGGELDKYFVRCGALRQHRFIGNGYADVSLHLVRRSEWSGHRTRWWPDTQSNV